MTVQIKCCPICRYPGNHFKVELEHRIYIKKKLGNSFSPLHTTDQQIGNARFSEYANQLSTIHRAQGCHARAVQKGQKWRMTLTFETCGSDQRYLQCLTFAWAEVQKYLGIRLRLVFPPPLFCEKYCVFFAAFESFPSTCQHFDSLTDFLAAFLLQCHHALFSPYFLDLPHVSSDMCAETALCSSAIFHIPCTGFGDLLCKQQCKRLS